MASAILGGIFGGGTTSTLVGAGFDVSEYTYGTELLVQAYQDIEKEKDGGWFHSDKTWTETVYSGVESEITAYFKSVFDSFTESALSVAEELGVSSEEAILSYVYDVGKINLKDLTGDEISDTLINVFSEVGDEMFEALFGDELSKYQE